MITNYSSISHICEWNTLRYVIKEEKIRVPQPLNGSPKKGNFTTEDLTLPKTRVLQMKIIVVYT